MWSYGPASDPPVPITTDRDLVRRKIGDTNPASPLLLDEEIAIYLTGGPLAQSSVLLAASMCAADIAATYSRMADIREGAAALSLSQLSEKFMAMSEKLQAQAGQSGVAPAAAMAGTAACSHGPAFTRRIGDDSGAGDWPHQRGRLGEW